MALTREELKTIPYTLYTPDDLRLALNEAGSPTGIPIPNKQELEDAFGGMVIAGKNTVDYGQGRNQNFVNLLANFASINVGGGTPAPDPLLVPNPLVGQSWYELDTGQLRVFSVGGTWDTAVTTLAATAITLSPAILGETELQAALEAIETALDAGDTDLDAHLADTTDAHDASAISVSPAVDGQIEVQAALEAIETTASGAELSISNHIASVADAHDASAISFVPFGSVTSLNVQDAIEELEAEVNAVETTSNSNTASINGHISDAIDAHDASAVSYDNGASGLTADEVQAAIDELAGGGLGITTVFISSNFSAITRTINTVNLPALFGSGGNPGPDLVQLELVCVNADLGYVTGDIVVLNEQGNQQDEASGPSQEGSYITWNPSSPLVIDFLVNYSKGNTRILIAAKGSTAQSNLQSVVTANWDLRLKAIKFG